MRRIQPVCQCLWCACMFLTCRRNTLFCTPSCRNKERYYRLKREEGKPHSPMFFKMVCRPLKKADLRPKKQSSRPKLKLFVPA